MAGSTKRYLVIGGLAAAVVVAVPAGPAAQGAAPCPAGTEMPNITASDFEAGTGGALTATHTIDVNANFSDGLSRDDFQVSGPAGVNVRLHGGNGADVVSDAPGALPLTMTWTEHQTDGTDCTASTGTTLQLQAPTPLSFGKLPRALRPKLIKVHGKYYSAGFFATATVQRYTDLRPIEMRFRGIARARVPSPAMPFKIATVALRSLDPGQGKQRYLRGPKWQVTGYATYSKPTVFQLDSHVKTGSIHNHPIGYELQVLQAGRLMLRVQQAGKCNFGGCIWRTMKVQRGT